MKIQRLCCSEVLPAELYYRGHACTKSGLMSLEPGEAISFDTYFNLFSVSVWKRYTNVKTITIELETTGEGSACLIGFNDASGLRVKLAEMTFSSENEFRQQLFKGAVDDLPEHLYVRVKAGKKPVIIKDIAYCSDKEHSRPVRVACSFCTFRREQALLENVRRIAGIDGVEIYISDNGHTLTEEMFSELPGIHLFRNKNYGGSAGFTRCMIEAVLGKESEPFTHVLLMDDDALIETYVVERTIALLSVLKPEYQGKLVGGAMLSMEQPAIQMENGAWIDPKTWRIILPGIYSDLTILEHVLYNQKESRVNYNGWFFCCIPESFITEENLPLPMFLHADDQEYGIRNKAGVIRMNGICIWHPNPWSKKRSYIEYYDARNGMIAMSRTNPEMSWIYAWIRAFVMVLRFVASYRYADAEYLLRGYRDYYKGPDWFKAQDPEKLNHELLNRITQEPYTASEKELGQLINDPGTEMNSKKIRKVLNILLPAVKQKAFFDINLPRACIFAFGVKQYCVVDPITGEGYRLEKNIGKSLHLFRQLLSLGRFMAKNHRRIHREWGRQISGMGTYQFWMQYLGLGGENRCR